MKPSTYSHPRNSILSVPPEVLRLIFTEINSPPAYFFPPDHHCDDSFLRRETFRNLSLTCGHFLGEARCLLYAEMTSHNGSAHFKFLSTIIRNPHYAAYVRAYYKPTLVHKQRGNLWGKIQKALELMAGLKDLIIRDYELSCEPRRIFPVQPTAAMLARRKKERPALFQLDRFGWYSREWGTTQVLEFLTTQHKLKHLRWAVDTQIPQEYVPKISHKLVRLDASSPIVHALLPGRTVTELKWDLTTLELRLQHERDLTTRILKMPEFLELKILSLVDWSENQDVRKGSRLLKNITRLRIGPLLKLEVLFNHGARAEPVRRPSLKFVRAEVSYDILFPGLKNFLIPRRGRHYCLGPNYGDLRVTEYPTLHMPHDCEYGSYIAPID